MPSTIRGRFFIGGCSRSGTTFLQRLLARHSRVHTFPETGVFLRALGMRGRVLPWARLGLTLGKERTSLVRLLDRVNQVDRSERLGDDGSGEGPPPLPPRRFLLRSSAADVTAFLDALALRAGKDVWLEKTPRHVLHARRIRRLVPGSRFIHMIRSGPDVVASIVDRARKHPERFRGQEDPAYGIRQWNRSIRATLKAMDEPGHLVVRYRELATEPEETLRALCRPLGLEFEAAMLDSGEGSPHFVLEEEAWKAPREGPIRPAASKFRDLFDEANRDRITRGLDMESFEALVRRLESAPGRVWVGGDRTGGESADQPREEPVDGPPEGPATGPRRPLPPDAGADT